MNTQEIFKSKKVRIGVGIAGGLVVALIIFAAGVNVGFFKAKFSCKFGENYERNFMGHHGDDKKGPMPFGGPMERFGDRFEGREVRNAHGIGGTIISIADGKIVVKDKNNNENIISVSDKTAIKKGNQDLKLENLKNGDEIVVMGKPGDDGVIAADLIRVFNLNEKNNE